MPPRTSHKNEAAAKQAISNAIPKIRPEATITSAPIATPKPISATVAKVDKSRGDTLCAGGRARTATTIITTTVISSMANTSQRYPMLTAIIRP